MGFNVPRGTRLGHKALSASRLGQYPEPPCPSEPEESPTFHVEHAMGRKPSQPPGAAHLEQAHPPEARGGPTFHVEQTMARKPLIHLEQPHPNHPAFLSPDGVLRSTWNTPCQKASHPAPGSGPAPPSPSSPLRVHRSTRNSLERIPAPARHLHMPDPGAARSTWNTSRPERPHGLPSRCRTGGGLRRASGPARSTWNSLPGLSTSLPHRVSRPEFHVKPLRQEFFTQCPARGPGPHPEHPDPLPSPGSRCFTWNLSIVRGPSSEG
jgi:hypothetical protein